MKLSTLVVTALITLASTATFAEGGAEHAQQFYDNFRLTQQQVHSSAEATASSNPQKINTDSASETAPAPTPEV